MMHRLRWIHIRRAENLTFVVGLGYFLWFLADPELFSENTSHLQDIMAPMGFGLLLVGFLLARLIQEAFVPKVAEALRTGVIIHPTFDAESMRLQFDAQATKVTVWVFVPLLALYQILLQFPDANPTGYIHLVVGGTMGLFLIAVRFAQGVTSGLFVRWLAADREAVVFLNPRHPDGAAGLGKLGHHYLNQALVLLLPAVFMAGWIVFAEINMGQARAAGYEASGGLASCDGDEKACVLPPLLDPYIVCASYWDDPWPEGSNDATTCDATEWRFLWNHYQFYPTLILFNLIIFSFAWVLPMLRLSAMMRQSRRSYIRPRIAALEDHLRHARIAFWKNGAEGADMITANEQQYEAADLVRVYRACPGFPLPFWQVATAFVSNLSAIVGLIVTVIPT